MRNCGLLQNAVHFWLTQDEPVSETAEGETQYGHAAEQDGFVLAPETRTGCWELRRQGPLALHLWKGLGDWTLFGRWWRRHQVGATQWFRLQNPCGNRRRLPGRRGGRWGDRYRIDWCRRSRHADPDTSRIRARAGRIAARFAEL